MKFLTTNFVRCPIKACDSSPDSFPLKFQDTTLIQEEQDFNPQFIAAMLERLDWPAVVSVASDLGNNSLPSLKPENISWEDQENSQLLKDLHTLLLETKIVEGKMVCRNCHHIFYIKESIANFLLPPHLAS
ncbi:hypothetical protein PACTADRAFT_52055 [Pachysolen tannophilus NRRL Y-2460]|uniref:Multifunctional methyltransferase subunit trm112 n=1 Tax=Pachysolen tannophilus NRRL Y-2460 TaxID=669874 RepID=A0A1E4TNY9_PACTA|nr:hypothetical protein PACTADRAFT_46368 [Pachysolen tannophilus NRRL Y-2460]ODV93476.1 hypothetical protein PACTADRAFT_52055 [Pachysolen tannophilus NRRL Y-2460]